MDANARVRKAQTIVEQVAVALGGERGRLEDAAAMIDDDVPDAMINEEIRPSLVFVVHGRLETALEEFDELLDTLADTATLDEAAVERDWRKLRRLDDFPGMG